MKIAVRASLPAGVARPRNGRNKATVAAILLVGALAGCSGEPDSTTASADLPKASGGGVSGSPERDVWYATYVMGAKVGYQHSAYRLETRDGKNLTRIDSLSHLVMKRGPSRVEMDVHFTDWTTEKGELVEFKSRLSQLGSSIASSGRVDGGQLHIDTDTQGKKVRTSIAWPGGCGGFNAVEQSLEREPLRSGQRRSLKALLPIFNQVGTIELVAGNLEQVKLLSGSYELLRIESTTRYPGGQLIRDTLWTDRTGQAMKIHSQAMDSEMYRTAKEVAQDKAGLGQLDFNLDIAVPVDKPLKDPHRTKRVRYRITLERGDPAAVFVSGASQRVKPLDARAAELTVLALRPGDQQDNTKAAVDKPDDGDRKPNNLVQSDDPKIVAAARKAVGDEQDPWKQVLALERYTNGYVTQKNFTKAFATASEVLASREGDCTEHAVLLAAMARSLGIPARVAIGLVYQEGRFYFHMWNEVYVQGQWIPVDATLARGGIGAAHLKLAQSNLEGGSAFSSFLPVAQVLGRGLKIEVLDVNY